ncbi:hypothetical protein M4D71_24320 [Niallia taxi]|uniref:hypothetical protein n=1 Tax=Niallia taxi TaxID=2499688 RepID=UPI0021A7F4EF|nr:hypothetical protein [Niallia taxi]MCT2347278.1 hypothetical protein [Niallia taxi]
MTKQNEQITLAPVPQEELAIFKTECQEAFMKGLQDSFPEAEDPTEMGPVTSDEDYEQLKRVGSNIKKRVTIG